MYVNALKCLSNVTVSNFSPRDTGETSARSVWKEIKPLPWGVRNRINLIAELASKHEKVHLRVSTTGHRARIFVVHYLVPAVANRVIFDMDGVQVVQNDYLDYTLLCGNVRYDFSDEAIAVNKAKLMVIDNVRRMMQS